MSRDELAVMDGTKCILQLRGVRPFFSDKYDITRHKRYKELSDYKDSNAFDVESYLRCELKMSRDEVFDVIEMDGNTADEQADQETEAVDAAE
ncbi:MAG: hypothetical protein IJX67_05325 [Oscillospiraceae bacterium]|nr:hypothetical protein [Oscillospiraceae bacterium]